MIKKVEKISQGLIILSLFGLLIAWVLPEPVLSVVGVAATVTTMTQCDTSLEAATTSFGSIDNQAVYNATTIATTATSSGSIYMKIYDLGSTANPGLWKSPDLIESPNAAEDATATLVADTEGYGLQATTADANVLDINPRYDYASSATNTVGGLCISTASKVVASSTNQVSGETVYMDLKTAVSITTPAGDYVDQLTIQCTAS